MKTCFAFRPLGFLAAVMLGGAGCVARAGEVAATFTSTAAVPVTADSFTAAGNSVNLALGFAPAAGTSLTVVNNLGLDLIQGTFDNLTQGQVVRLTHGGMSYPFVASYFGGTGNDLVLQWANTRLLAWGANTSGQLGNNSVINSLVPTPVTMTGVLAERTPTIIATGTNHSLALCADGILAAWGSNEGGTLGNHSTTASRVPVLVDRSGVLAGRTIISLAVGRLHSLALCTDGVLAAWGSGEYGQLGNGSTASSSVPVAVDTAGVLAGKTILAVAAGTLHNLALCTDGTLAAWGSNTYGQLGNNGTASASSPVLVDRTGVLAGKTIVAIGAGNHFSVALCADGTLAAWGQNHVYQLGNGTTTVSRVPALVDRTGVLLGKTVAAMSIGWLHSLVLCTDGTLAAWGSDGTLQMKVPTIRNATGPLAGKNIVDIGVGDIVSQVLCADGTLFAWGSNDKGQLGNNTTARAANPSLVNLGALGPDERVMGVKCESSHSLALVALPPPPVATTLAATPITDSGATLQGSLNANNTTGVTASFEFGLTTSYGTTVAASPATASGTTAVATVATPGGLLPNTTYHYRLVATSSVGTARGEDMTFTTTGYSALTSLTLAGVTLYPSASGIPLSYLATVPFATASVSVTAVTASADATVTVNGTPVIAGTASEQVGLAVGTQAIQIVVTAADGINTLTYTVMVTRLPAALAFNSATEVPVTADEFVAAGNVASLALNYVPVVGTRLTVVNHTGRGFIQGYFDNLAPGQRVQLSVSGVAYSFIANYHGGTGNDLVLEWATTRVMTWGDSVFGQQLGQGDLVANNKIPGGVVMTGALAGKTVIMTAMGDSHTLTLTADGTLAAWGAANQLGNGNDLGSNVPTLVDQTGVLAGKTVIAIMAGGKHNLALCDDGTLASWGFNTYGQLGNQNTYNMNVPDLVDRSGVLAGKTVVALAAGDLHSLALCDDGTLAAWGHNSAGQLGDGTTTDSNAPVRVDLNGVLAGKTITRIAAGNWFSLAVCADGTVAAWGYNFYGQLGNNSTTSSAVPVLVNRSGVLAGRTVTSIVAATSKTLALCSDGTLAAWGNTGTFPQTTPEVVAPTGALAGKTVVAIACGSAHHLALCSDGTIAAWGSNSYGALGNDSTGSSTVPVSVNTKALGTGERFMSAGGGGSNSLALVASPPSPMATTQAPIGITDSGATLNGSVNAQGSATTVLFEYGLTTAYGTFVPASPATVTGAADTAASVTLSGLRFGTTYHYRIVVTSGGGTVVGADSSFTTTDFASLSALTAAGSVLNPSFSGIITDYFVTVPHATESLGVTPVPLHSESVVTVNGLTVNSGAISGPLALGVGNTAIPIRVTAADGINTTTYTLHVTRQPAAIVFNSSAEVPMTDGGFQATGDLSEFVLEFAPSPGTTLMVARNTGLSLIAGTFANLPQGGSVTLTFNGVRYAFLANYFGGSGNDLVLQWANTRLLGWGSNSNGELGNGSMASSNVPVPVTPTGVLAGKAVMAIDHGWALCADGTLAGWGDNANGQLGNNSTTGSLEPTLVDRSGVLAGRTITAISSSSNHTLALCADGALASWGSNSGGKLGNNGTTSSIVPVLVDMTGVLSGKSVIAISAGDYHSLALCADGTVVAWGTNTYGALGNHSTADSSVPVPVDRSGVLSGKTVVAIAAGGYFSVALCADGTLTSWGINEFDKLGDGATIQSSVPVLVNRSGVLAGKLVIAISAGPSHSLALCSDGTIAAWGFNAWGQLGNNSSTRSNVPVLVNRTGVLSGKEVVAISAGETFSQALCADGTMATWGYNNIGQLGTPTTSSSKVPVLVSATTLKPGERFVAGAAGASYNTALVASPPPPLATTLAATGITTTGASLNGNVNAQGSITAVAFEYGLTEAYGTTVAAVSATVTGTTDTAASATLTGLPPGTTHHFRIVATSDGGVARGADMTFTTGHPPTFAGYAISTPFQAATTVLLRKLLAQAADADGDALAVTAVGPLSAHGGSAVLLAAGIRYSPPAGYSGADTFPVTITDSGGAAVAGTVTVTVGVAPNAGGVGVNPPVLTSLPNGKLGIAFQGIPGRSYLVQRSVSGLDNWVTLATIPADASGKVSYTDEAPPAGSAFYRLGLP